MPGRIVQDVGQKNIAPSWLFVRGHESLKCESLW
jgi:hypothetical protein